MPAKAGIQFFGQYWVPAFAGTSGVIGYPFTPPILQMIFHSSSVTG
jgi:hypothetical protein